MEPVVLAISGASAQPLAQRALEWLLDAGESVELVTSRGAIAVWQAELGIQVPGEPGAQERFWRERTGSVGGSLRCHRWNDQAAAIASGSYRTRGMVILPASMGTVGRIASGVALDLVERAADVHLKEARPLVICPRETPWSLVHLRNLTALAEAGARIAPPVPAWYHQPRTIDDMVDFLVARIFDLLHYNLGDLRRWHGPISSQQPSCAPGEPSPP
jgi:4-hydroxy-3-polyprenylbenzoate decarboxylase